MKQLRAVGASADQIEKAMLRLHIRPVLTAHPTESTRRTLLGLQARVADGLLAREAAAADEIRLIEQSLEGEVELLWLTSEVRQERPTVLDEVSTALWYLETRLLEAGAYMHSTLALAFENEFARTADSFRLSVPLRFGTWVGGDRDGNPYVTPEITIATSRRASYVILGRYVAAIDELTRKLSLASSIAKPPDALRKSLEKDRAQMPLIWRKNRRRNADEPLRLKLSFIEERLEATRRLVASRDAGRPRRVRAAYPEASAFEADLELIRDVLLSAGAEQACRTAFDPLLATLRAHGFHGLMMDVRDHADVHTAAINEILPAGKKGADAAQLRAALTARSKSLLRARKLSAGTKRVIVTFRALPTILDGAGEGARSPLYLSCSRRGGEQFKGH